jgi:oxysterol-binding protein-related protein 9/10/11
MANNDAPDDLVNSPTEDDPPISVPDSGEGGKVKMIVQLVKKCLGVKDIAAMFVSFVVFCF